jgi:hypothetical protein
VGEAEWKEGQADLTFAGIERARLPVYPLADHFAEKLHAYTRPGERRTRVKDLLDLTVILEELADDLPSAEIIRHTIEATFDRTSRTSCRVLCRRLRQTGPSRSGLLRKSSDCRSPGSTARTRSSRST